jgi:hypothetical protein
MNLAIRGIDFNLGREPADTFTRDQFPDLRADFILANPPFNISDWWHVSLSGDARWVQGDPPAGNANYVWLQHMLHHLKPGGRAGIVLAKGKRARRGEVLFIDARKLATMISRVQCEFTDAVNERIAGAVAAWRGEAAARGEQLGLSGNEVRFYDALADNESAVRELTDETLTKIAHELADNLRRNLTVDWSERESVQAKLRLMVKRILRKYKSPPDQQDAAVELVLQQAKALGEAWARGTDGLRGLIPTRHIHCIPGGPPDTLDDQQPVLKQVHQVACGGGLGGARQLAVLVRRQPAQKAAVTRIEQPLQHLALPFVRGQVRRAQPERGLVHGLFHHSLRLDAGHRKCLHEPSYPGRDIQTAALGAVQGVVVGRAGFQHLPGQAEQACGRTQVLGQGQVHDGPPQPAIAIFKRMDGFEPEMGHGRPRHAMACRRHYRACGARGTRRLKPRQEVSHLCRYLRRRRGRVVDSLAPMQPADDLHGVRVLAVATHGNPSQAGGAAGKQG